MKIRNSPFWFIYILLLSFILAVLIYIYSCENKVVEIIVTFWGGFVATLIGVYLSLLVTTEQSKHAEKRKKHSILLSSLKLIYSELDINEMNLQMIQETLDDYESDIASYYDDFTMLNTTLSTLKDKAFYGLIASGSMEEITTIPKIYNSIQQAYFNMGLTVNGFNATRLIFKGFKNSKKSITAKEKEMCINQLELFKKRLSSQIGIIIRAKKEITTFLIKNNVSISIDPEVQKL